MGLIFFGVGDILGAGIYGLIGVAAGEMGHGIWIAFLVSALAAGLTGLSYATLGSRYPKAAGAAYVVGRAFQYPWLSYIVGVAVCCSAITSIATATRVISGYWAAIIPSEPLLMLVILGTIGFLVFWGIRESLWFNTGCTLVELSGLVFIIVIGVSHLGSVNYFDTQTATNPNGDITFSLILTGAILTFYSFLGFEDVLNVAEEVKDPQRILPRGLLIALGISTVVYLLVSLVAVSVVPPQTLATSSQPLVDVVTQAAPWAPSSLYRLIAVIAVTNTLLLNFIMSSRLLYGMATQDLMPKWLGQVHPKRKTPHLAILLVFLVSFALALTGDISRLARATSVLLLMSFLLMNLSLARLQQDSNEEKGAFEAPRWVPYAGAFVCILLLAHAKMGDWQIAISTLGGIVVLYLGHRQSEKLLKRRQP